MFSAGTTSRNDLKTSQEKNREAMTCKLTAQWYPSFVLQWVICTAACKVKNPTITEMGVSSHIIIHSWVLQLYVHLRSMQKMIAIYL
jgi:hypothetical protein